MHYRTLLIDDNPAFLALAPHLLAAVPEIEIIAHGSDGLEAIRLNESLQPDLILMDLSMPGMNGLQATRAIKQCEPAPIILITSQHDDQVHEEQALAAGADGFVNKNDYEKPIARILRTLRKAAADEPLR